MKKGVVIAAALAAIGLIIWFVGSKQGWFKKATNNAQTPNKAINNIIQATKASKQGATPRNDLGYPLQSPPRYNPYTAEGAAAINNANGITPLDTEGRILIDGIPPKI